MTENLVSYRQREKISLLHQNVDLEYKRDVKENLSFLQFIKIKYLKNIEKISLFFLVLCF